ncbi:MAG: GIY-YIG nuclease family protein [Ignavibacteriae bacterium]|nr:MAG: GIY-YIG nuclease family protein [Ignavibacteriota bacterium]
MGVFNKRYYVYILTNKSNKILYTGYTCNLQRRISEHKFKVFDGFTKKYNVNKLVYYEIVKTEEDAKDRERQIKAGSRKKKVELIESITKEWNDLSNAMEILVGKEGMI